MKMISDTTKLRISTLLKLAMNNNFILSLQTNNPKAAYLLKITIRCIFFVYIYYHLFVLKNLSPSSFLSLTLSVVGVAQFLGFFPALLDISFYFDHKNYFHQKLSVLEFLSIMRCSRSFLNISENYNVESDFISSLTPKQQLILLKLGSDFKDLSYLKTETQHALEIGLQKNSLQWIAMKSLIKIKEPLHTQLPPCLQEMHIAAKTYLQSDDNIINEAQAFMAATQNGHEQEFNIRQLMSYQR